MSFVPLNEIVKYIESRFPGKDVTPDPVIGFGYKIRVAEPGEFGPVDGLLCIRLEHYQDGTWRGPLDRAICRLLARPELDKKRIQEIARGSFNLVHVEDCEALKRFQEGNSLFDIDPRAELLREFVAVNGLKLGQHYRVQDDGDFRWVKWSDGRVYWILQPTAPPGR